MKYKNSFLITFNLLSLAALFFFGFSDKNVYSHLETKKLVIGDSKDSGQIVLEVSDGTPVIRLFNAQNAEMITLQVNGNKGVVELNDFTGQPRLQLSVDERPGVYIKGSSGQTLGSWTLLSDGGAGFGLADSQGMAASILRGGLTPSMTFYSPHAEDPMAAMGLVKQVPHIMIAGQEKNEGILLHGGEMCGMMVVDEKGALKILISKHGVFQKKSEDTQKPKKEKFFSLEDDSAILFPRR